MPLSTAKHRYGVSAAVFLAVALVCTGVVSGAHYALTDAFAESDLRLAEAAGGEQRKMLFPEASSFEALSTPSVEGVLSAYKADTGGFAIEVEAKGYAGMVHMMVGIASSGEVVGIQIVESKETNGIGTKAFEDDYLANFMGATLSSGAPVDVVSGATFTSKAMIEGTNIALQAYASLGGK